MKKTLLWTGSLLLSIASVWAAPAINDLAVDFPFDGGGVLTYTRSWPVTRHLDLGVTMGGGLIDREFDLDYPVIGNVEYETEAVMVPFIGPRLSLHFEFIGFSVGYGFFYADTDITARDSAGSLYTGSEKGWGSGFYAPLLVLDFYNNQRDIFFGVGLGGFLGASYNDLEVSSGATRLVTDESPIDGLTLTLRMRWIDGRGNKRKINTQKDDF